MAQITFKGKPIRTSGNLPALHIKAPDFKLVDKDLNDRTLHEFQGKRKLIATVPSLDTGVCSLMTKHFNEFGKKHPGFILITVSSDLPFAQKRFCETEHVGNVLTLSMMRNKDFGKSYGILIEEGPLAGILARSVTVLDEKDHVLYTELVGEITQEPNYHKALEILQGHQGK
jgi:thiol peroxidase